MIVTKIRMVAYRASISYKKLRIAISIIFRSDSTTFGNMVRLRLWLRVQGFVGSCSGSEVELQLQRLIPKNLRRFRLSSPSAPLRLFSVDNYA